MPSDEDCLPFPEKLKSLREKRGWSMNELARRASVSPSIVHDLEKGKRTAGRKIFAKLATAFGYQAIDADLFVSTALECASKQKTLDRSREWPTAFSNWMVLCLKAHGVERDEICGWRLKSEPGSGMAPDLLIELKEQKLVIIQLKATAIDEQV